MEEADHQGRDALCDKLAGGCPNLLRVQRLVYLSVRQEPLIDLVDKVTGHQRYGFVTVKVRGVLQTEPAYFEHVTESPGHEESRRRPVSLNQRVHCQCGPVHK